MGALKGVTNEWHLANKNPANLEKRLTSRLRNLTSDAGNVVS